jgi:trans-2,3-dihydro-3-hydroxyanthranilate isomerase
VVHDADDLDEQAMLAFARETRLSETSFVQTATVARADYRNRIWTIARELPFAGHPSLGAAVAVALRRGDGEARYLQQTPAGLQPVQVRLDGDRATASMHQELAVFGDEIDPARAMAAVGLAPSDAARTLPPQVVSTGVPHLLAPVAGRSALTRARPCERALGELLEELGAVVLYLAWVDEASGAVDARGLSPVVEGGEDPATGSAAGPLCAYLARRAGVQRIAVAQGAQMGRASRLRAEMDGDRPRVSGGVVVLIEGTLWL